MANFEVFLWSIKLSTNPLFLKSDNISTIYVCIFQKIKLLRPATKIQRSKYINIVLRIMILRNTKFRLRFLKGFLQKNSA